MVNFSEQLVLITPPIVGGIIGYFTNDLAIKMLFRPYRPLQIYGRRIPFTPGLIPRNQERLAKRISDTIMGSLLTPEELQKLARRLLETERMQAAISWFLRLASCLWRRLWNENHFANLFYQLVHVHRKKVFQAFRNKD